MVWLARTGRTRARPAKRVRLLEDGGEPLLPLRRDGNFAGVDKQSP
jgi:hypothetical protein